MNFIPIDADLVWNCAIPGSVEKLLIVRVFRLICHFTL